MNAIELFGLGAVSAMLLCWALEDRSRHFVLLFAFSCLAASGYAAAIGSWPFAAVELLWSALAFRRWSRTQRAPQSAHL